MNKNVFKSGYAQSPTLDLSTSLGYALVYPMILASDSANGDAIGMVKNSLHRRSSHRIFFEMRK